MKRLIPFALLAFVTMSFTACETMDPISSSKNMSNTTAENGGIGGGIVSSIIARISDDGFETRVSHFNPTYWHEEALEREILAVEGGFTCENPQVGLPNDDVFVIEKSPWSGSYVYKYGVKKDTIYGAANAIDIATGNGITFALNASGEIFTMTREESGFSWHSSLSASCVNDPAIRIDVEADGTPWVISRDAKAYRYENGSWVLKGESATYKGVDIGCGDGIVYAIATQEGSNNMVIWRYTDAGGWKKNTTFHDANRIDVDRLGNVWIHNFCLGITQEYVKATGEIIDHGFSLNNSDIGVSTF